MTNKKTTPADELSKAERRLRVDLDRGNWVYGINWARDMRLVLDAAAALAAERDRADRAWSAAIDRAQEELVRRDQFSSRTLDILDDVRKEATA